MLIYLTHDNPEGFLYNSNSKVPGVTILIIDTVWCDSGL